LGEGRRSHQSSYKGVFSSSFLSWGRAFTSLRFAGTIWAMKVLKVQRIVQKQVNPNVLFQQLRRCIDISLKGGRGKGFNVNLSKKNLSDPEKTNDGIVYTATIKYGAIGKRIDHDAKWPQIVRRFAETATTGNLQNSPWLVIEPEGFRDIGIDATTKASNQAGIAIKANEPKQLGEINLDPTGHFDRIYGRDPHISRIMGAMKLGLATDWHERIHSILNGPPGSGKTELMKSFAEMLGKEGEAWLWFDATSTTRAGAIEQIINAPKVPPVLFIEEIEKTEETALRWLLGIMDQRGEVRRLNYRTGPQAKNVRMVVVATANDVPLLQNMMAGALYSRFQNKLYCSPPDRIVMEHILRRELKAMAGDELWIEPTLKFGFDEWCINDPRELKAIMAIGRERLLTGEAQLDYLATMNPTERARLEKIRAGQATRGADLEICDEQRQPSSRPTI
jgi:hypothetical protein